VIISLNLLVDIHKLYLIIGIGGIGIGTELGIGTSLVGTHC